jgi:4-amino-4-deoxy-L-arabinose transferase-like glycosyltransferase
VQQYVHDEYIQVLAEVGAIGAALLAAVIAGIARLLWRSRPRAPVLWAGVLGACAAAAVGAGFDFVWHVPVVLLTVAALVGLAVAPATSEDEGGLRERRS